MQLIGAKSREEILGKKLSDFFPPSITNPFDAEDRALIQSGQSLHDQERDFPNQKGKKLLYLYTKVPLMNGSGHARGLVIIARDITEKKQAEALILRNQRLENIGALASGIAHDLNNILAPILMSLQILRVIRPINPKIRIIVASGWENFTSDPSIADLQPDALLPKPFTAEQMLRAVQSVLSSNAKT